MSDEPKRWAGTESNPIADIEREAERIKGITGDPPNAIDVTYLGLFPGRRVTFHVDGSRVVADPPAARRGCRYDTDGDGNCHRHPAAHGGCPYEEPVDLAANEAERTFLTKRAVELGIDPPTFDQLKRTVAKDLAAVASDVMVTKAKREQLGVPGCRCGCSDGRRTP